MPTGYLRIRITQQGTKPDSSAYTNSGIYHKQLNVLPYSASVARALIRPTEEGMIKHKALTAMEEQTSMQLDQIRNKLNCRPCRHRRFKREKTSR